ncbi:MFS transporter [Brevibacillus marinus]|uniref:MFS transporter n=1 Tax=Brevibacillus marinus TaxID=2496837 RepID=UPI001F49445E|nr:MFS transporter [Brevibacillus marinus]
MSENSSQVKVLALITAACLLGDSMLYVVMPTHWREFGLTSLWEVGVLLSVNRLVRLPLTPVVGWLYQHLGMRQGVAIAVLLAVLTTAGYGLLAGFWPLLLMRCLWGVAWSFLRLGANFAILEMSDERNRGRYMGTFNGLYRLGSLAGMLGGALLADLYGVDPVSLVFAAITLLALPFALRWVPADRLSQAPVQKKQGVISAAEREQKEGTAHQAPPLWRNAAVSWTLLSGLLLAMLYQGIFTSTLSYLLEQRLPGGWAVAGIVLGAATLAGLLQALRWGWEPFLAPWFGKRSDGAKGRRPLLVGTLTAAGLLFAAVPLDLPFALWLLVLLAIQLTSTVLTTVMDALATDVASHTSKVAVITAYTVAIDLGAALGPFSGYLVEQLWGTTALYLSSGIILLLVALRWGKMALFAPSAQAKQL